MIWNLQQPQHDISQHVLTLQTSRNLCHHHPNSPSHTEHYPSTFNLLLQHQTLPLLLPALPSITFPCPNLISQGPCSMSMSLFLGFLVQITRSSSLGLGCQVYVPKNYIMQDVKKKHLSLFDNLFLFLIMKQNIQNMNEEKFSLLIYDLAKHLHD